MNNPTIMTWSIIGILFIVVVLKICFQVYHIKKNENQTRYRK